MSSKVPAVILGDDTINCLGVARNLGRTGVKVFRIGSISSKSFRSKYLQSNKIVPTLNECAKHEYITALKKLSHHIGEKPVLFPISDIHVLKVAQFSKDLSEYFHLFSSDLQSAETLVNKTYFYRSLQKMKIPHPKTRFVQKLNDFEKAAEELGYPVFIRPENSPLFAMKFNYKKGFVAHNRKELDDHLHKIADSDLNFMIQEIIPGNASCMCGCAGYKKNNAMYSFCYQRVREYPLGFGNGSLLNSIPSFINKTRLSEYLTGINYNGIYDAEFKRDPRDGIYKLIEINARTWWQNTLPTKSGINLVRMAYENAAGDSQLLETNDNEYEAGVKWVYLYQDYLAARELGIDFFAWLLSLRGKKTFAVWALDDPYPMTIHVLPILFNKLMKAIKLRK